ncbi:ribosomal protection-like ABC-F family protein [Thomasclavelia saccharogumia]|uniref:ribosomal protection-like ABC-F family protein n=1 Tax=Thomasclavelia saccharogumia TaxID=341225 RepID=UPI00047D79F6|nr:ABC-F family ATP-binding cassette domain-containing protein [Thomasclavelia saccharogumia]
MLIECSNITKSFQGIPLLKDITFKIDDHDKIAIIGVNGAGKTTILKIISGEEEYDGGNLFSNKELSLGYLKQQHDLNMNKTVYDTGLDVFAPLLAIENRLRELEVLMSNDHSEKILNEYDRLTHEFQEHDGYSYPSKLTGVLKGLGFSEEEMNFKVSMLSGGQKTRLALAKMLLKEPKLLLLDEPTNHLDNSAINFLEGYLKNYPHAIIVVSHDRYFIDKVSNKIIEIENGKSKTYKCKYNEYSILKKKQRAVDLKHYLNQQKEIKRIQQSIDTLKSYNREKQVKRAESKEKQLAKMERIERPENLPDTITINFKPKRESGFDVLKIENLAVKFDEILFKNINIEIKKQERVALVGDNGIGKTTLFRTILNELSPFQGKIKFGSKVDLAYYAQEHQTLSMNKTIFNEVSDNYPKMTNTEIRNSLALFNFKGEDVFKEISLLSGGEKGRVVLTEILLKQANFLILDEPTNHLDIASKEVLEDALNQFDGTIFFISHDRYFINKVATRVIELTNNKAISYEGNYDTYFSSKIIDKPVKKENTDYQNMKQQNALYRKQQNKIKKIETNISNLENQINILNKQLQSEEVLNDYQKYNQINDEIALLENQLNTLMEEWEALQ